MNGAERDAIRVMRERHIQNSFSNCFLESGHNGRQDEAMKELSPSACEEQQGSLLQAFRPQTYDALGSKAELPVHEGLTSIQAGRKDRG